MSYQYDHRSKTAGKHSEKLHKGFVELQHAITTIDQVEFETDVPPAIKSVLKGIVKELEAIAVRVEKAEHSLSVLEKSAPSGDLSYEEALKEANKVGASHATGLPLLAQTISVLALRHAINPALAYEGAKKRGLDAKAVRKLLPVDLGNLMF